MPTIIDGSASAEFETPLPVTEGGTGSSNGTASLNINGTVGATTPAAGSFSTGTFSENVTISGTTFSLGNIEGAAGGVRFKFLRVIQATATTFFTTPGNGEWCGVIEVTSVAIDDVNRSGYLLARFAYDEAFTTMTTNVQNTTIALSMSGNDMQVTVTGGSSPQNVQIRIMGAQEA